MLFYYKLEKKENICMWNHKHEILFAAPLLTMVPLIFNHFSFINSYIEIKLTGSVY